MEKKQKKFFIGMIVLAIAIAIIITLLIVSLGTPVQEVGKETKTIIVQPEQQENKAIVTAVVKDEETGGENE